MSLPKKMKLQDIMIAKIREYCDEYGLSYSELAGITGIPKSTITDYMTYASKDMRLSTLVKLANGFNITLRELFEDERFDMIDMEDVMKIQKRAK